MPSTTFSRPISAQLSFLNPTWKEKNWRLLLKRQGQSHGPAQVVQRSALQTTVQVRENSHWCAHVGFLSFCPNVQMKLVFSVPTHDWQGGS